MLEAFIGYNIDDYENDEQNTKMSWQVHDGGDHLVTDHDCYVRSSETAAETACRFSSRSEDEQDRTEAIHSRSSNHREPGFPMVH